MNTKDYNEEQNRKERHKLETLQIDSIANSSKIHYLFSLNLFWDYTQTI